MRNAGSRVGATLGLRVNPDDIVIVGTFNNDLASERDPYYVSYGVKVNNVVLLA